MKLIAVSGLNRTEWKVIDGPTNEPILTECLNPYMLSRKEISRKIRLCLPESFFKGRFSNVYFYGTGCFLQERKNIVAASLIAQFRTDVQVSCDLLGAARALYQKESGIACVLEKGSGSCLYDGNEMVRYVLSGGFAMGDEGGGSNIGRFFLGDVLKDLPPQSMIDAFTQEFHLDKRGIMNRVYCQPQPQQFFCDVALFLSRYTHDEYVNRLISFGFRLFFKRNVCQLGIKEHPVRIVGTIAYAYKDLLQQVAREFGVEECRIERSPMDGLVTYHKENG